MLPLEVRTELSRWREGGERKCQWQTQKMARQLPTKHLHKMTRPWEITSTLTIGVGDAFAEGRGRVMTEISPGWSSEPRKVGTGEPPWDLLLWTRLPKMLCNNPIHSLLCFCHQWRWPPGRWCISLSHPFLKAWHKRATLEQTHALPPCTLPYWSIFFLAP